MKRIIFLLLIGVFVGHSSWSQDEEDSNHFAEFRQCIFLLPQYVAVSGIRIDYERKFDGGKYWMVFAPQMYSNSNGYDQFDSFTGFGLNAYYKKFLSHSMRQNRNGTSKTNIYFSGGPVFQYFKMKELEQIPEEFVEDGITYIRFNSQSHSTKIYRLGADAISGCSSFSIAFPLICMAVLAFVMHWTKMARRWSF
jgi:hypothetical protein